MFSGWIRHLPSPPPTARIRVRLVIHPLVTFVIGIYLMLLPDRRSLPQHIPVSLVSAVIPRECRLTPVLQRSYLMFLIKKLLLWDRSCVWWGSNVGKKYVQQDWCKSLELLELSSLLSGSNHHLVCFSFSFAFRQISRTVTAGNISISS